MQYTKLGSIVECHDCEFAAVEDYFVPRQFEDGLDFICRVCETKYPKTDPRDWRMSPQDVAMEVQRRLG